MDREAIISREKLIWNLTRNQLLDKNAKQILKELCIYSLENDTHFWDVAKNLFHKSPEKILEFLINMNWYNIGLIFCLEFWYSCCTKWETWNLLEHYLDKIRKEIISPLLKSSIEFSEKFICNIDWVVNNDNLTTFDDFANQSLKYESIISSFINKFKPSSQQLRDIIHLITNNKTLDDENHIDAARSYRCILIVLEGIFNTLILRRMQRCKLFAVETIQKLYNHVILNKLDTIKQEVMLINSVLLRLETIENIFSLLFLQQDDIVSETSENESENDSESNINKEYSKTIINNKFSSNSDKHTLLNSASSSPDILDFCSTLKISNLFAYVHNEHGFLCDPYFVRDVLLLLNDIVSVFFNELSTDSTDTNNLEKEKINVTKERLIHYLDDAIWKFSVVYSSDMLTNVNFSEDLFDLLTSLNNFLYKYCLFPVSKHKFKKKYYFDVPLNHTHIFSQNRMLIMFSWPSDMIILSLCQQDFSKAFDIIKKFNLYKSWEEKLTQFSELYIQFQQKVITLISTSVSLKTSKMNFEYYEPLLSINQNEILNYFWNEVENFYHSNFISSVLKEETDDCPCLSKIIADDSKLLFQFDTSLLLCSDIFCFAILIQHILKKAENVVENVNKEVVLFFQKFSSSLNKLNKENSTFKFVAFDNIFEYLFYCFSLKSSNIDIFKVNQVLSYLEKNKDIKEFILQKSSDNDNSNKNNLPQDFKKLLKITFESSGNLENNILHSLYDYLKKLKILGFELNNVINNPFSILNIHFDNLIKHFIFSQAFNIENLKQWLKELGLNFPCTISKVLLYPYLNKKSVTSIFKDKMIFNQVNILNLNQNIHTSSTDVIHPELLVRNILSKAHCYLLEKQDSVFYSAISVFKKLSKIVKDWNQLIGVDLELLSDYSEMITFWLNLANLLTIYSTLQWNLQKWEGLWSSCILYQMMSECCVALRIGKAGVVTLFDIKYRILGLVNLLPNHLKILVPTWMKYVSKLPHDEFDCKKYYYALWKNQQAFSDLQIFNPTSLEKQLNKIQKEYKISKMDVLLNTDFSLQSRLTYISPEKKIEKKLKNCKTDGNFCTLNRLADLSSEHSFTHSVDEDYEEREIPSIMYHYLSEESELIASIVKKCTDFSVKMLPFDDIYVTAFGQNLCQLLNTKNILVALLTDELSFWEKFSFLLHEDLNSCQKDINNIKEYFILKSPQLIHLLDLLTCAVLSSGNIPVNIVNTYNVHIVCECVLHNIKLFKCNDAIHLLKLCQFFLEKQMETESTIASLKEMINKVILYHKISQLGIASSWQEVEVLAESNPLDIICFLNRENKFDLIHSWKKLHLIPQSVYLLVYQSYIMSILDNPSPDLKTAIKIFESMNITTLLAICEYILKQISNRIVHIKLLEYMINCPWEEHLQLKRKEFELWYFGLEILQHIPTPEIHLYEHLSKYPLLLLEQLLMNMKLEYFSESLNELMYSHVLQQEIDNLLYQYAKKALEIRLPHEICKDTILNINNKILNMLSANTYQILFINSNKKKKHWVPDNEAEICMICQMEKFSMFTRRHHCRKCGKVVCGHCSSNCAKIEGYGSVAVRICDQCYNYFKFDYSMDTEKSLQDYSRFSNKEYENRLFIFVNNYFILLIRCTSNKPIWKLQLDEEYLALLREEFSYDFTPNISLCMSILDICIDKLACASFKLDLCKELFITLEFCFISHEIDFSVVLIILQLLIKSAEMTYSNENDFDMMNECCSLAVKCDILKVLINSNCCPLLMYKIISFSGIKEMEKLRDLLIKEQLWDLALEVSTKAGLDCFIVWALWGKECLKIGEFKSARIKFDHAFKSLGFMTNQESPLLCDILNTLEGFRISNSCFIVSEYEKFKKFYQNNPDSSVIMQQITSLSDIINGCMSLSCNAEEMQNTIIHECLYYLKSYGSHAQVLSFYCKQQKLTEGINYAFKFNVEPDICFLKLFLPYIQKGKLMEIFQVLHKIHKQFPVQCITYINHCCTLLENKKMLHTLYHIKRFYKDFVHAAIICIKLSKQEKLYSCRMYYLSEALKHLQSSLNNNSDEFSYPLNLYLSLKEVNHLITVINLQIACEKYLLNYVSEQNENILSILEDTTKQMQAVSTVLLAGKNIESGFGIAFRIIHELNLDPTETFNIVCQNFIKEKRNVEIVNLVNCIRSSGSFDASVIEGVLLQGIELLTQENNQLPILEDLMSGLISVEAQIKAFIKCGRLKSAYILAVQKQSVHDIKLILEKAESTKQLAIANLCNKWLSNFNIF